MSCHVNCRGGCFAVRMATKPLGSVEYDCFNTPSLNYYEVPDCLLLVGCDGRLQRGHLRPPVFLEGVADDWV